MLDMALGLLRDTAGIPGVRLSPVIETEPVGPPGQGPYLNAAASFETTLTARTLLDRLLTIERRLGRDRAGTQRWGPRTIDLDLLLFGDSVINEPGLVVPHPRLTERRFVLGPLAAIEPDLIVPGTGRCVRELLAELPEGVA